MSVADRLTAALSGRYRIERELGAGGMATVYLAQDLKHDRKVALKVLKPELAAVLGAERFVVEIKTTASLQHPHILPLFDSGTADGFLFYVMPFIEGETLRDKLNRETQLGVDEAVRIAREVADALDYAHSKGIIHRDIKPENILLANGRPMVADFGIALAVSAAAGGRMTETGLSLGTPHYMSPEQATAEKEISARSDVYSLATVLFEMLAGEPPHSGGSAQAIIMKIIAEPAQDVTKYRKSVPANVAAAVAKALEKVPADRLASAKAFADALSDPHFAAGAGAAPSGAATARPQRRVTLALGAALGFMTIVAALALLRPEFLGRAGSATGRPAATFVVASLGVQGVNLAFIVNRIAVTPDGRWIAFVASGPSGAATVYLRSIDDLTPRAIAEGLSPVFSPDGKSLAYADGEGIMTVPVSGGVPSRVARHGMVSGAWGVDGGIRYVTGGFASRYLYRVSVADGARDSLAYGPDTAITLAELLPDERLLLSLEIGGIPRIAVRERDGRTRVLLDGAAAHYVSTGHLVLTRRDGEQYLIFGVRFDAGTATLRGSPEPLARGVSASSHAAATSTGDLVYLSGITTTDRQIVAVDRLGDERPITRGTHNWSHLRLGADGSSLVGDIWDGTRRSVYSVDGSTGAMARLTREIEAFGSALSPDARTVYFTKPSDDEWTWKVPATGGTPVALDTPTGSYIASVSRDGSSLWLRVDMGTTSDIWRAPLGGAAEKAVPVLVTPADERDARPSPDGRWLAYATDASGRQEVVLAPMATPGNAVQVSTEGGRPLNWSRDGRRLFYRQRDEVWEIAIGPGGAIRASARRIFTVAPWLSFVEIAPDGERLFAVRGGLIYSDLIVKQGALK